MVQQTENTVTPTRDRILRATVELLRRKGYEGTGVKQIAREANATLGSLYHFFPEGKEQLATEALRIDAEHYAEMLREAMATSDDPAEGIAAFAARLAVDLRASDWCDACIASAAALERIGSSKAIQQGYQSAMESWRELIAARLRAVGVAPQTAEDAACFALSALEGAEIQSRVTQSDRPLQTAGVYLAGVFQGLQGAEANARVSGDQ